MLGGGDEGKTIEGISMGLEPLLCPLLGSGSNNVSGLELSVSVSTGQGRVPGVAYVDCGSTGNFVSPEFTKRCGISLDDQPVTLQMANESVQHTLAHVYNLQIQCGRV